MALSTKNNLFPTLTLNQFEQTPARGMVSHGSSPNIISVRIDPSDTKTYFVGDVVKINTTSTLKKGLVVEKATSKSKSIGIIIYNTLNDRFSNERNSPVFEICFPNINIYMEVSESLSRGDRLCVDESDKEGILRLKKAGDTDNVIAIALEPASSAGDIIIVAHI